VATDAIIVMAWKKGIILHKARPKGQYVSSAYVSVNGKHIKPTPRSAIDKLHIRYPVTEKVKKKFHCCM
jgi:hypothetical protein